MAILDTHTAVPNIYDVARVAGVSTSTVSRVLNGMANVKPQTCDKVIFAIKQLNFRPSALARGLALKKTKVIGLLLSNLRHRWATTIIEGLESVASEYGYNTIVCNLADDLSKECKLIESLLDQHPDGVILMPGPDGKMTDKMTKLLYGSGVKTVLIWSISEDAKASTSTIDFRYGRYIVSKHLIEKGHQRICIVTGSPSYYTTELHIKGHNDAVLEYGIDPAKQIVMHAGGKSSSAGLGKEIADAVAKMRPLPTAIIAVNDMTAIGIVNRFVELGIRVPGDISVTGFDNIDIAEFAVVPLTTVDILADQMAKEAGRILISPVKNGQQKFEKVIIKPKLVIRRSTL